MLNRKYPEIIMRRAVPDIVHTRLSDAAAIAGYWGQTLGVPTIGMFDKPAKAKYYRHCDHYTSCSRWVKDYMTDQGIPEDRVDIVYNSVDVGRYARDAAARNEFRRANAIDEGDVVFVGAGRFDESKGFDVLIRAFAKFSRQVEHSFLVLAGSGEERAAYVRLAAELGVQNRVLISKSFVYDIRPWLWGADAFVLSSKAEPFGIIVLEAMASGLPIIATSTGAPPEFIEDGRSGLLTPPSDPEAMASSMMKMYEMDKSAKNEMKAAAMTSLSAFTSEAIAVKQIQVYERVLERSRERRGL